LLPSVGYSGISEQKRPSAAAAEISTGVACAVTLDRCNRRDDGKGDWLAKAKLFLIARSPVLGIINKYGARVAIKPRQRSTGKSLYGGRHNATHGNF
jgi:hypothetical protein